jgi:catechol 2,3-dioxygenase
VESPETTDEAREPNPLDEQPTHIGPGAAGVPLLVLHPCAAEVRGAGVGGFYHVVIHLPNEPEFARVLGRIAIRREPVAPTDHLMSKALYLNDPDGIGLELTLETPERGEIPGPGGMRPRPDGQAAGRRGPRPPAALRHENRTRPSARVRSRAVFRLLRMASASKGAASPPGIGSADLHTGGAFKHRMAINVWHDQVLPSGDIRIPGLRHFTLVFDSPARLTKALSRVGVSGESEGAAVVRDPVGSEMRLSA